MTSVPADLQPFLPSSPVANLDPDRDKNYIIESLLKHATLSAWRWLWKTYAPDDIAAVVKSSRSLHPRDATLWSYLLNIPAQEILCLQPISPQKPKSSWAY